MIRRCLAAVVLLSAGCAVIGQEPDIEPEVRTALIKYLRFTNADLAAVRRGEVVKHGLPSRTPGEIAVAGAVRITAPKSAFFDRVRDIARFKSGPDVLQIGRFSTPPALEDLAALTVDQNDFDPRSCRVGECGIRLPAAAIERLAREIDRDAPDAQARAAAWFKQFLLDTVVAHLSGSDHDLQYDDGQTPIRPRDELRGIVGNMPEIDAVLPAAAEKEQFVYWSKEKFGLDPFITVTHVTIACRSAATCLMTTSDVYSSRYLDASMALAIATDAGGPDAFYLIYDNRSRANALKGFLSGLRRSLAERRARGGLEDSLKAIRARLHG
jgi:hypothetical protein